MINAEEIAEMWMDRCCQTVKHHQHAEHMNLISKDVKVFGVKGFDVIEYKDWYSQCEHEFKEKVIEHVEYRGLKIGKVTDSQIMFFINEAVFSNNGAVYEQAVEVVLAEEDGQWRAIQQRVLTKKEAEHFNLN